MKNYIVSYNFRDFTRNYLDFYDTLKKHYPEWQHPMENSWLIKTDDTAEQINEVLRPKLYDGDSIFIAEITDNYAGWMGRSAWKWLKSENGYQK